MAELKHRLYWIKRHQEGIGCIEIAVSDREFFAFYLRYFNYRSQETAKETCRSVLNDLTDEGYFTKEKGGYHHNADLYVPVIKEKSVNLRDAENLEAG